MLMAILASVIQVLGLIPPYFELAKRSGRVIGIDFYFLAIDYAGAFFSLMAVVAQQWFDALGASLYIACLVLETGIFVSQGVWMWRFRGERAEAKKKGVSFEEYMSGKEGKGESVDGDVEKGEKEEEKEDDKEEGVEGEKKEGVEKKEKEKRSVLKSLAKAVVRG